MQNEKEKINIKSLLPDELKQIMTEAGEPSYRSDQIFRWLGNGAKSFDDMVNIPKPLRQWLNEKFFITIPTISSKQISKIDGTIKYLWTLADQNAVECVIMKYRYGNTICVSSQVGCPMGCSFCASTIGGKIRNLEPSEILDQVLFSHIDSGVKLSNIVMMGIGEPLDNFDNVIKFIRLVNDPNGLNFGMRHITVSTCGLTEKIDMLAEYNLQLTLSVSLHAPDDETRSKIMPINKYYGVENLINSCKNYSRRTGRRISFEYAMINGVNDTPYHAKKLVSLVKGMSCHINLIPLNEIEESWMRPSTSENMKLFMSILTDSGINVTVRRKLGPDIDASCGQLRRKNLLGKQT